MNVIFVSVLQPFNLRVRISTSDTFMSRCFVFLALWHCHHVQCY